MELPSKVLEQKAFNTRPKIEEHMLVVVDKSIREEHLYQPLLTNDKQFKIAVTFLTGYNGIFNLTPKNNKFHFMKSSTNEDGLIQITKPPNAYEIESLNEKIKQMVINEGHFEEPKYPCTIKSNISTLGSTIEISPQGSINSFMFDDSMRDPLGFYARTLYENYNLSPNHVDILSFDIIFGECNIAQGMIFEDKRSRYSKNINCYI